MDTVKINYDVDLNFYMRIHDAEMFGGEGSVGYSRQTLKNCQNFDQTKVEAAALHAIKSISGILKVSPDKIELITFQEYQDEAGDEEDEDYENACSD